MTKYTAREKVSTGSRIQPLLRLVCAVAGINDASAGHWNGGRIPGILGPGDGEPQRLHAECFGKIALW